MRRKTPRAEDRPCPACQLGEVNRTTEVAEYPKSVNRELAKLIDVWSCAGAAPESVSRGSETGLEFSQGGVAQPWCCLEMA